MRLYDKAKADLPAPATHPRTTLTTRAERQAPEDSCTKAIQQKNTGYPFACLQNATQQKQGVITTNKVVHEKKRKK